jgi:hypothetical protein
LIEKRLSLEAEKNFSSNLTKRFAENLFSKQGIKACQSYEKSRSQVFCVTVIELQIFD